jgi:uncharacterized protein YndB with AHSA1/START domain
MNKITVSRLINAPVDAVFRIVSDVQQFSKTRSGIVRLEFISDVESGVGTKFRETRRVKNKEMTMDFEITEYVPNDRVRIVNDTHGTIWDTLMTVEQQEHQTKLTLEMDARAYQFLPRIIYPFIRGMVQKSIEADMDSVKAFCEDQRATPADTNR